MLQIAIASPIFRSLLFAAILATGTVAILSSCGCQNWRKETPSPVVLFNATRIQPDAVVIEVAVAEIPSSEENLWQEVVSQIDMQSLPISVRKQLDQNGLVAGTLPAQLPPMLFRILELTSLENKTIAMTKGSLISHQKIQNRDGETHWIQTGVDQPQLHWTVSENDFQSSGACRDASPGYSITTYPQGDGRVRLLMTPEIRYEELRPRFGVSDIDFSLAERRKLQRFEQLQFDAPVRHGHTLVVWSPDDWSLGGQLFQGLPLRRRFLLVRVVQTQMDDLFAPRKNGFDVTK